MLFFRFSYLFVEGRRRAPQAREPTSGSNASRDGLLLSAKQR
jgi:hypothetical protein